MYLRSLVTSKEDVWYDFKSSVGLKFAKKWKNVFDQNVPIGSLQGAPAALLQGPSTFWSNTFFHFSVIFDPTEP